jgi:hypothetical protein
MKKNLAIGQVLLTDGQKEQFRGCANQGSINSLTLFGIKKNCLIN